MYYLFEGREPLRGGYLIVIGLLKEFLTYDYNTVLVSVLVKMEAVFKSI